MSLPPLYFAHERGGGEARRRCDRRSPHIALVATTRSSRPEPSSSAPSATPPAPAVDSKAITLDEVIAEIAAT